MKVPKADIRVWMPIVSTKRIQGLLHMAKETLERLGLLKNKVLCDYFGINQNGLWENDQYVFYRSSSADDFMQERSLTPNF